MSISAYDIECIRYIQEKQKVSLEDLSKKFNKNSTTLRRTIDTINLYSIEPILSINNSICSTKMSYQDLTDFIQSISLQEYRSSQMERINVVITSIFFDSYVNTSSLYEAWNLSLTTKKKDMSFLRTYLQPYDLALVQVHKKGLTIQGNPLMFRLLVTNILYPLYDLRESKSITQRVSNTPIERQCYSYIEEITPFVESSLKLIYEFLENYNMQITTLSEKFILLFICFMQWRPLVLQKSYVDHLPLPPTNMYFCNNRDENQLYNIVFILLDYSKHLDFPFDSNLYENTKSFVEKVQASLTSVIYTKEELVEECYAYFYRMILMKHLRVELHDRLIRHMDDNLSILYQIIQKYARNMESYYHFTFNDEQYATLTFIFQKMIMRNRIVTSNEDSNQKKVVIISNSTYERIDYFIAQIQEYFDIHFVSMLNLNKRSLVRNLEYDYILCLSERIYNILKKEGYQVLQLQYFLTSQDIEKLTIYGFHRIKTKFLTEQFVEEIESLSHEEMILHLKEKYSGYFI